jgi:hypothetical protein
MRRRFTPTSAAVLIVLVAILAIGVLAPAALAASKYRPVVSSVTPDTGVKAGGAAVVITGKFFRLNDKRVVTTVTFGGVPATRIRAKSATTIRCLAPVGKGVVHVRVTTTKGTSKCVAADHFTYMAGPATMVLMSAGDAQTASAGATVAVKPCVRVVDADGQSVAGFHVYFDVTSGGGSVTGADAVSDASGIATVGSWTLGGVAGVNTLTASAYGLTGSPVTFTATGGTGILLVKQAGVPVRSYTLAELQAMTPFTGFAGIRNKVGTITGPEAVTAVKVTDVVANALGAPLTEKQSVKVADVYTPKPFSATFTYAQLMDPATCCTMYTPAGTIMTSFTGTLAAVLVYSDPAGGVMPTASGPLRFFVADTVSETAMSSSASVSNVDTLDVITP